MIYRSFALLILLIFYGIYIFKMLAQRTKGIKTDQMAKGKNKNKKLFTTELLLKISTYSIVAVQLISIFLGKSMLGYMPKVIGIYIALVGDAVFLGAVYHMKDSWRAGIPEDETKLITNGIYKYSRNPAFLGFDLTYIGLLLMYFNIPLLIISLFAMVMLHLQILQEEKFLPSVFGQDYLDYKKNTGRYLGSRPFTFKKLTAYTYLFIAIFSVMYTITCIIYCGLTLSFLWIWPALFLFSLLRFVMIVKDLNNTRKFRLPKWMRATYYTAAYIFVAIFIFVEACVILNMNAIPEKNLDYVIVLGAGLRGNKPSRPLNQRIITAAQYLTANENTICIASGGKGNDEQISEAECIKRELLLYGISKDRIILEDRSTSTIENIRYSYEIIKSEQKRVGIISNGFHIFRAMLISFSQGHTNVHSVPAETLFPVGVHYTVREFFGVVQLVFFGKA